MFVRGTRAVIFDESESENQLFFILISCDILIDIG